MKKPIYLDYAATTPIDPRVLEKMMPFLTDKFGNAHSRDHRFGWDASEAVEEARYHVAGLVNATPNQVTFTSGATESINQVLKSTTNNIVTTKIEHDAVLTSCEQPSECEREVSYIAVDGKGRLDLQLVRDSLRDKPTSLLVVMAANNEIGNVYPAKKLADIAHEFDCTYLSDATQAIGKIPIDTRRDEIDFLAISSHKVYGPKGAGAVVAREPETITAILHGGGQERGLRSGTLNVPAIVGFGEACRLANQEMQTESDRLSVLRDELERAILADLPDTVINGDSDNRLSNIANIGFEGADARAIIRQMQTVAVSTKSSCSSNNSGPSRVLLAIGHSDERALGSIRFSVGRFTTEDEVRQAALIYVAAVQKTCR